MTTLLERERELAELGAVLGEVRAGTGRLVAIEAPAGLGKTRLLQAARDAGAEAGLRVLAARATELERDFPFALVRQLFEPQLAALSASERDALFDGASAARGALGLSAGGSGTELDRDTFSVLHGLYWLTAGLAERHPLLLAIDDAHWSDAASLDYLSFLLPRLEELPVLVVLACRPASPDGAAGLAQIVTDGLARRLTPQALSSEAATRLLATELNHQPEPQFATACHEVSGGNPFLLRELARTLVAQGIPPGAEQAERVRELAPERVNRTVLLRIARLSREARAVARALAVLGDDSDRRLVSALVGLDASSTLDGADTLRAAAILDAGAPLRFIHPLVRNAVYSDLPAGERAREHARAAALLRDRGASPEQIATQLVACEAQGECEAVETLLEAGTRALASGAPRSAIAYLMRALREPPSAALRVEVLGLLLTASIGTADHSVYAMIEPEVFAELERTPSLLCRWAPILALWLILNGRLDDTVPLLERAIEISVGEDDIERAVLLEAQLSSFTMVPPAAGRRRLDRYRGRIDPDSATGRLTAALEARWVAIGGSVTEAAGLARQALAGGKIFAEHPEGMVSAAAVIVLILADELDGARRATQQALAQAQERWTTLELMGVGSLNGMVAWARGDLAAAEVDLRQALELARLGGLLPVTPLLRAFLIDVLIERGELRTAVAELDATGMATGVIPEHFVLSPLLFERGQLSLVQGRPRQAAEDFVEFQRRAENWGIDDGPVALAGSHLALALTALGERERAREPAERALVQARRWGSPVVLAHALRALGLTVGGPAGLKLLEEAVALLEDSPARLVRAHALSDLGAGLRRANHRAQAREPLREALELARACGAVALAKRVHEELLASGEKVRRYSPIGVDSLTPSERRVAELAASGMTNRRIAQTLVLTVKTIESHLSAAYDKLGIRSRHELAAALGEKRA